MDRHTLIFSGNGSYSNKGCEAIVRGTTTLLHEQLGDCRFISNYFPSEGYQDAVNENDPTIIHRPFPILKRYSLPWFEDQINRKIFHQPHNIKQVSQVFQRSLREAEAVLMLGGDNFSLDYADFDVHFRLCQIAAEQDLPVAIWGASVGPFTSKPDVEKWAAKELRRVTLICARETTTIEYLASIGVMKNVILTADPSFYMLPSACDLPVNIEKALASGCIGLNLSPLLRRFLKVSGSEPVLPAWTNIAVEIVRNLLNHFSLPVLLIPHVTSEIGDIYRDDYLFMSQISKLIHEPERVLILGPSLSAAQTKWVLSRVRVFAGARTHATLAAISSSVPTVCIGYSIKAKGIAQDVYGNLDWLIRGQDLVNDPSALKDRFVTLFSQEPDIRTHLEKINPELKRRAGAAAEKLKEAIDCHNKKK